MKAITSPHLMNSLPSAFDICEYTTTDKSHVFSVLRYCSRLYINTALSLSSYFRLITYTSPTSSLQLPSSNTTSRYLCITCVDVSSFHVEGSRRLCNGLTNQLCRLCNFQIVARSPTVSCVHFCSVSQFLHDSVAGSTVLFLLYTLIASSTSFSHLRCALPLSVSTYAGCRLPFPCSSAL